MPRQFTYKNLSQLQQDAETRTQHVRFETDKEAVKAVLGRKVRISDTVTLGNAMAIHPMEGCDSTLDGNPDELTWRRYERFALGGAKLLWFEATAIREDGRANARQLWIHEGNVDEYARLHARMIQLHEDKFGSTDDLLIPIQLTHSGRYSYPKRIIFYHNPVIDQKTATPADYPVFSDAEMEALEDQYIVGAKLAWRAGFRAIDLKVTHGYLLAEMLGARAGRDGQYAGSSKIAPVSSATSSPSSAPNSAPPSPSACASAASIACRTRKRSHRPRRAAPLPHALSLGLGRQRSGPTYRRTQRSQNRHRLVQRMGRPTP